MGKALILLVEGKKAGESSLAVAIGKVGHYQLAIVHTGGEAIQWLQEHAPDLVIYDSSYMRSGGARTCRRLKRELGDRALIHVRLRGQAENRAANADVYLAQPFTARKLLNRVRSLLPADDLEEEVVRTGELTVYLSKRSVEVAGQGERRMTPKLTALLGQFLRQPGRILSRSELMYNVWHTEYVGDTRTLDVHIRWIRELIESNPAEPQMLRTVRGVGYVFGVLAAGPPPNGR
jgi:DNA-binding response OmpR family regulator